MKKNTIIVIDFGSQYNQLIVRRVRESGVYCELCPPEEVGKDMARLSPAGFIASGSPSSLYDEGSPRIPTVVLDSNLPLLGICYGMHALAEHLGGEVRRGSTGEYGFQEIILDTTDSLLKDIPAKGQCWMSHGDVVTKLPEGATRLGWTENVEIAAFRKDGMYGVQFHPEVSHTAFGKDLIRNFLEVAGCDFTWTPAAFVSEAIAMIQNTIGGDSRAICAVSGGVDSMVAAVLAHRALGERLHCVFVDNGLLRKGELGQVSAALSGLMGGSNIHIVNASDRFLEALEGVTDPEQKRKIIGGLFIRVFEEVADDIDNLKYLIQGTLYPDVIESRGSSKGHASCIKTHHNVGGLPENLNLSIVEPLRYLFKDEVRRLGRELGVPGEILGRQPFPGPGLAVRIIGEVTDSYLEMLRAADAIVTEEIEKARESLPDLWQFFPVFVPLRTVGVMGDKRTYSHLIALRVVSSLDGMTCDWVRLPWELLARISSRIVNEVRGINRVVYDITTKPPATIEWE